MNEREIYNLAYTVCLQPKDILVNRYLVRFLRVDGEIFEVPTSFFPPLIEAGPEHWDRVFITGERVIWTEILEPITDIPNGPELYSVYDDHWTEGTLPYALSTAQERLDELIALAQKAELQDTSIKVRDFQKRSPRREVFMGVRINEFVIRFDFSDGTVKKFPTECWSSLKSSPQEWNNYELIYDGYGIGFPHIKVWDIDCNHRPEGSKDRAFYISLEEVDAGSFEYPGGPDFSLAELRKKLAEAKAAEMGRELDQYTDPLLEPLTEVLIDGKKAWRSADHYEITLGPRDEHFKKIKQDLVLVRQGDRSIGIYMEEGVSYSWRVANRGFRDTEVNRIFEIIELNEELLKKAVNSNSLGWITKFFLSARN